MKRLALFALVTLVAADVDARDRRCRPNGSRTQDCDTGAFFEAFPASGAGTSGVCSTTAPTGAKGEAATVTRATSAMCQRTATGGMVSSGISTGDLTLLASGVARVEYDRSGVLGVRVESAVTSPTLRSQEINVAPWADSFSSVPTTAVLNGGGNTIVAPDGTTTAEDYTYGGAGWAASIAYSYRYQPAGCTASVANTGSCYFLSISGGTTADVTIQTAASWVTGNTTGLSTSTWTRAKASATSGAGGSNAFYAGIGQVIGATTRSTTRVGHWGCQCETGPNATSYVPTAGAGAVRNADVVSFPVTLSGGTFSAGISYDTPATLATGMTAFQVYLDANNSVTAALDGSNQLVCTFRIGGVDSTVTGAPLTAGAVNRVACTYSASSRSACVGGTCFSSGGALTMPTGAATFYGGTRSTTGNEANGILSRWCYEFADATRCVL